MDFHRDWQIRTTGDGVQSLRRKFSRRFATRSDASSGFGHKKERMDHCVTTLESTRFNGLRAEQSSFALSISQSSAWETAGRSTAMFIEGEKLSANDQNLPLVEKLIGLQKPRPQHVFQKRKMSHSISETDLSLLETQKLSSRKHGLPVNWLVSPQQRKMHLTDSTQRHDNALKGTKNSAKKLTARISKEGSLFSLKRHSYQVIKKPSRQFHDLNSSYRSLLSSSRKEFPKRLKMTNQHKEYGQKSSSTSDQIFASTDGGIKSRDFGSSVVLKIINEKSSRAKKPSTHVFSSAIRREDGLRNGKFVNLPSPTYARFSSTASHSATSSKKQAVNNEQRYSIKDILNLRARNLMKTTEKTLMKSDKKSEIHKETSSDNTVMNYSQTSIDGIEAEPQSPDSCKPNGHMSPVSVLELQLKEENADAGFSEDEFMDDEERDYSYLLDMLIISGIHGVSQERLYNAGWILKFPVEKVVFEKLEKNYCKLVSWSSTERRLFFDRINSTLGEVLAPCMDFHPWIHSSKRIAPMWGSEGLVEKVWEMLIREHKRLGVGKAEEKALDGIWLDLGNVVNEIGVQIEEKILEELLEEFVSELI